MALYDSQSINSASALADLTDVNISNPTDGQILQYDATSQKWVNEVVGTIPVGAIATPTDDIQTWLHCAAIWNKNYTLLSEVLADSSTLLALISMPNAVDYMVRSTTWVSTVTANSTAMSYIGANNYCANELLDDSTWRTAICNSAYFESVLNVKVPTMTSDNTPSGECFASNVLATYAAYKAFDNDKNATFWATDGSITSNAYIGYRFPSPIALNKIGIVNASYNASEGAYGQGVKDFKLQVSNDDANYIDIFSGTAAKATSGSQNFEYFNFGNNNKYQYCRLYCLNNYGQRSIVISQLQFYGRA